MTEESDHHGTPPRDAGPGWLTSERASSFFDLLGHLHSSEMRSAGARRTFLSHLRELFDAEAAWIRLGTTVAQQAEVLVTGDASPELREPFPLTAAERRAWRTRQGTSASSVPDSGLSSGALCCAPILGEHNLEGLIAVQRPGGWTDDVAVEETMTLVGRQLGRAIGAQRRRDQTAREALDLRRCFTVSSRLTAVTLRNEGSAAIAETLADILDRPVVIEQAVGRSPYRDSSSPAAPPEPARTDQGFEMEIASGAETLGTLLVLSDVPLSRPEAHALRHAAVVAAPVLLHEQAAQETQWRIHGNVLEELVGSTMPLGRSVADRAADLGVNPDRVAPIMILQPAGAQASEPDRLLLAVRTRTAALSRRPVGGILAFERTGRVVVSVGHADPAMGHDEFVDGLHAGLLEAGLEATAGVSLAGIDAATAYREAMTCLAVAQARGEGATLLRATDLGPVGVLLRADRLDRAVEHVKDVLGPIAAADEGSRVPLLDTLVAFVECGGDRTALAARQYVHRSTLTYRLSRVEKVIGQRLDAPDTALLLRTAVQILRVLEARGLDPLARRP